MREKHATMRNLSRAEPSAWHHGGVHPKKTCNPILHTWKVLVAASGFQKKAEQKYRA